MLMYIKICVYIHIETGRRLQMYCTCMFAFNKNDFIYFFKYKEHNKF